MPVPISASATEKELPPELVSEIVSNITDFHQLLNLRLVSKCWKGRIEHSLSRRRWLAITEVGYVIDNQYSALNDRFFRSLENERFMLIQLHNFEDIFNMEFTLMVVKLLKGVEHFAFRAPLTSHGVTCLQLMLNKWTNLSTLSLSMHCFRPNYHIPISSAINNLKNLVRLDLSAPFQMSELGETLGRIHYLAVGFVESREQFLSMIFQIGRHCKHLWIENWCDDGVVHSTDIRQWADENPAFFRRLTHFGWPGKITSPGVIEIDRHFTSLTTWHAVKEYREWYVLLSLLPRLRELRVLHFSDPFRPIALITDQIIESTSGVRTFELHQAYCSNDSAIDFWMEIFIDQLRVFFANAQKVIVTSPNRRTIEMLERCVEGDNLFQISQSEGSHVWVRT